MSTSTIPANSDLFLEYLNTCKGEVKSKSQEGYYHVDVVADAYNQGFNDGEKQAKEDFMNKMIAKEIEKFSQKANQIYILSKVVIDCLEKNHFEPDGLHINLKMNKPSVIISVKNELLNNDDFVNLAYEKAFENKDIYLKLFGETLDIGFVASNDLQINILKEDGFGYSEIYTAG